ncbi:hypothetical protein ACLOJK_027960 [Asimina triloba]
MYNLRDKPVGSPLNNDGIHGNVHSSALAAHQPGTDQQQATGPRRFHPLNHQRSARAKIPSCQLQTAIIFYTAQSPARGTTDRPTSSFHFRTTPCIQAVGTDQLHGINRRQ